MSRPTDWWVLDLERDPTPGDPWSVRSLASSWDALATDAESAEREVRSLIGDGAVLAWVGAAGEMFRDAVGEFPGQLATCTTSYRLGAAALTAWASDLDGAQRDADHALALGREARADLQAATAALGAAQGVAGSAGSSSTRLSELAEKYADTPPPSGVSVPTREQVQAAQRNAAAAQARVRSAQADVSSAQSRLDAARRMALDAKALRESRGKVAAERIHDASDAGIPPNSFWEDFKDVAAKVWDVVIVIAKVVVVVLGVVALIIGGPLAWVVFAAGVLLLADALMKYLQGQGSLWDVAFAALGCIPGVRGLTTLGELATAFRSGATVLRGLLASGRVILGAAKTAVVGMAQAVRALGAGVAMYIKNLAVDLALAVDLKRLQMTAGNSWDFLGSSTMTEWVTPFVDGNRMFGAHQLPTSGHLYDLLQGWDRFAGHDPSVFLAKFTKNGEWNWDLVPPNGFDGPAEIMPMRPGDVLDRFGEPGGRFLSPDGTPFAERAIPHSNLDPTVPNLGYHRYEVTKPFDTSVGYIAPAFGQPGGGLQIFIDSTTLVKEAKGAFVNVQWLLDNGYLKEIGSL